MRSAVMALAIVCGAMGGPSLAYPTTFGLMDHNQASGEHGQTIKENNGWLWHSHCHNEKCASKLLNVSGVNRLVANIYKNAGYDALAPFKNKISDVARSNDPLDLLRIDGLTRNNMPRLKFVDFSTVKLVLSGWNVRKTIQKDSFDFSNDSGSRSGVLNANHTFERKSEFRSAKRPIRGQFYIEPGPYGGLRRVSTALGVGSRLFSKDGGSTGGEQSKGANYISSSGGASLPVRIARLFNDSVVHCRSAVSLLVIVANALLAAGCGIWGVCRWFGNRRWGYFLMLLSLSLVALPFVLAGMADASYR